MAKTNPNTTTTVRQEQVLPAWYQQYLQSLLGRTDAVTNEPYQQYEGPRVAGFTPDQLAAFQGVRDLPGTYQPMMDEAGNLFQQGAGAVNTDFAGAIQPGMGMLQEAGSRDTAAISDPYVQQGRSLAQQASEGNALSGAQPYLQASTNPMGLSAAAPYLQAASGTMPGNIGAYMSPYNELVTNRIAELGQRNLTENLLPSLSDDFIRSGQYGSTRQRDLVGRALRDTNESVLGQQAQVLESGYNQAGQMYQSDAARLAGLGATAGGLGTAQQQALLAAGQGIGNLTASDLQRLLESGQTIGNLGLSQAGVAGNDASRLLAAGQSAGQLGLSAAQAQAAQDEANRNRMLAAGTSMQGLGTTTADLGYRNAAALEGVGAAQQGLTQQNYDVAYGDFLRQQQYPQDMLALQSNIVHGLPVNTSSTAQTTGPATAAQMQPSTLGQVGGLALAGLGLYNAYGKAKGGRVRKQRRPISHGLGSLRLAA